MMNKQDLLEKITFIAEIEKLKIIYRQNGVFDKSRFENSAEHSWHITLMAVLLQEHTHLTDLDMLKVMKMLLIHDIVEIDAGDTFLYDEEAKAGAIDKERASAARIFGLLPKKQREEFLALWTEFEERESPEARYAASIDAIQPLLNHLITANKDDNPHQMTRSKVLSKKAFIEEVSVELWEVTRDIIEKSVENGLYLKDA